MSNEEAKMLSGKIYDPSEPELHAKQRYLNELNEEFNRLSAFSPKRAELLKEFAPNIDPSCFLRGPVYFDYGCNIYMGPNCYANYNLTICDVCPVVIGEGVHMGCNVSIQTPLHPMLAAERAVYFGKYGEITDNEYGKPIHIGEHCWIASNVVILPGVTIGKNTVIGAGAVVTRDIPEGVFAAGNPCRVIRELTAKDSLSNHPELFEE
ncbi:MAG: sugar O-acetyltransferase [Bacilli bacterium]|nr:sugar O-acetyltransferase [Bacilli bacterium]